MSNNSNQSVMQIMRSTSYLAGVNAAYVEDLYEQFLNDPQSVDASWSHYFSSIKPATGEISHAEIRTQFEQFAQMMHFNAKAATQVSADVPLNHKEAQVLRLIDAYRAYGHFQANLDPLNMAPKLAMTNLELSHYGLSNSDLSTQFNLKGELNLQAATLKDIHTTLKQIYCNTIGFEYRYLSDYEQKNWLQQRIETVLGRPNFTVENKKRILQRLTEAEGLEKYLGAKYVAQKRFSLEGGDSLIPLLDDIIQRAGHQSVQEIVMGMAHRGRLNVLVNIFGKSPKDLFQEFEGKRNEHNRSDDVKYHKGFSSDIQTAKNVIHLALGFNPSHLEIINPVIEGSVRARQQRRNDSKREQVIPILIHGDAAFAGQGIVMETMALSQTEGYGTGGTIHIVINNQVGFTTDPKNARSTWYCTDIAKMIEAPIFHVNGDDPEAVLFAGQLAFDFRAAFKKDVVIDLICYRRHGHNEADEPAATQPLMYQKIKQHLTTRKLYADQLIAAGIINQQQVDELNQQYRETLDAGREVVTLLKDEHKNPFTADWSPYLNQAWDLAIKTGVATKELQQLAKQLETLPADLTLQPQVAKMMEDRRKMTAGEISMNWGYAETLAYASLLKDGYSVRISGQDVGRGTFFHRHAVLHDLKNNQTYIPLAQLAENPTNFSVIDSILSEAGVMGFEYGYASSDPKTLVIWEAQYGDFVNGAQVVIDQFISSCEQKWGRLCGLTLLLPHGFEGSGPEHSSARLERFMQLCAEDNIQVCVPSTPAQAFHMLRRQMIRPYRKPLIVMTPKSLLRHKLAVSNFQDLEQGRFHLIIPEADDSIKAAQVQRIVLCSGKVYYDLIEQRAINKQKDVAIIRIEQLYPFPEAELIKELEGYKKAKEVIWCQEEPKNQGAWYSITHHLQACIGKNQTLSYAGRHAAAAPAVGSPLTHNEQQKKLLEQALGN